MRSFDANVQDTIEAAIRDIAAGTARASGTAIDVKYVRYYPATINSEREAGVALAAARAAGLDAAVAATPAFTSEDFAFMLRKIPGAYLWLGQGGGRGSDSPPLHHRRTTSTTRRWRKGSRGSPRSSNSRQSRAVCSGGR